MSRLLPMLVLLTACWDNPLAHAPRPDEGKLIAEALGEDPDGPMGPALGNWTPQWPAGAITTPPDQPDAAMTAWLAAAEATSVQITPTHISVVHPDRTDTAAWTLRGTSTSPQGHPEVSIDTLTEQGEQRTLILRFPAPNQLTIQPPRQMATPLRLRR